MHRLRFKLRDGYTLIELLTYIAIFIALSILLMQSLITAVRVYVASEGTRTLASNADLALDRMTREIRSATSLTGSSVFDADPSTLVLSGTDSAGAARTVSFFVQGGALELTDNGVTTALTSADVVVAAFTVSHLSNAASDGARIVLTLVTASGRTQRATFYASALTRGRD
jgi:hypothetical protein